MFWWLWVRGTLKLLADVRNVSVPLLIRISAGFLSYLFTTQPLSRLENFITESHHRRSQPDVPSIRRGARIALGVFLIYVISVIFSVHGFYCRFATGPIPRGTLVNAPSSRLLYSTNQGQARGRFATGKLVGMISTNTSRVGSCTGYSTPRRLCR